MEFSHAEICLDGKCFLSFTNYYLKPYPASRFKTIIRNRMHIHNSLEISYVKQGKGEYWIEDQVYDIMEGDIFLFNNVESHGIGVHPPDELINTVIHFEPRFIWSIEGNFFDSRYLKIFFHRNENFQNRLDRQNPATQEIRRLFKEIEEEFKHQQPEYELMVKVKLMNILVALIRHYGYTRDSEDELKGRRQDLILINKVMDYIDTHLGEDIRLEDLADITYMNASYFSTFFKKYNGISPSEYIRKKRIHRAIELLKVSDKTILDIASQCGFNSSSSFNKAFKKITGKVPSDFR